MAETLNGYARCSTAGQDLTVKHDQLCQLGVAKKRIYDPTDPARIDRIAGSGEHTIADLADTFSVSRTTIYRTPHHPSTATEVG
jgi:DNA invertase Pin-like site-specific DNA recombinase